MDKSLAKAINRAGSAAKLARMVGVSRQAVDQWVEVPPRRVLQVEAVTGVSRYELRPDIYGPEPIV